ncbi:MAG: DMT family transporter [Alphaproteobacteria bacterium]|nr:DMT family transporter [Alphaproteobacteria bacterium]
MTTASPPPSGEGQRSYDHGDTVTGRDVFLGAGALFLEIALSFVIAIFVKWLEPDLSVFVILFFRYFFCLPLLFAYGAGVRGRKLLHINNRKVLVLRIISGVLGLGTWFVALTLIDLSLATALSQTMPIFITVLAALIIGEKVGPRRIGAVVFGFLGVVVVLGPSSLTGGLSWGVVFGLLAPFFAALMFVFLRMLGRGEAPVSTALWYNMAGMLLMAGVITASGLNFPSFDAPLSLWLMLISIGVLASLQQLFMAVSHTFAPASVLAPVHYTAIPLGLITGVVFFDEVLSASLLVGTGVILAANYYILVRERAGM